MCREPQKKLACLKTQQFSRNRAPKFKSVIGNYAQDIENSGIKLPVMIQILVTYLTFVSIMPYVSCNRRNKKLKNSPLRKKKKKDFIKIVKTIWNPLRVFHNNRIFQNAPFVLVPLAALDALSRDSPLPSWKASGTPEYDWTFPVKNLISQRCHGEIMIYSQLPHTITSLQHHFEADHLTNHDINWRGHTCEFPVSSLWVSWDVADFSNNTNNKQSS